MEEEYVSPKQRKINEEYKRKQREEKERIERAKTPEMREAVCDCNIFFSTLTFSNL